MKYHFNDIEIDTETFSVFRAGERLSMEPLVFDLVIYLIENKERVVTRDELFKRLWSGREVSDATLSNHINLARSLLGDDGGQQKIIKTHRGRGYRFVAELIAPEAGSNTISENGSHKQNFASRYVRVKPIAVFTVAVVVALAFYLYQFSSDSRDGYSIAVLPFENIGANEEDAFVIEGIHGDLLTKVSKLRGVRTISRSSVIAYGDSKKRDPRSIAKKLNVSTILEGGVQVSSRQIRINAQLIEAHSGETIWAETYTRDFNAENILTIQSEIAEKIARSLKTVLPDPSQPKDSLTYSTEALEAWFYGKLNANLGDSQGLAQSIIHFEKAVESDPNFAKAHAQLALSYLLQIFHSGLDRDRQLEKAAPHIDFALKQNVNLSDARVALALAHQYQGHMDKADLNYRLAIDSNPNNAFAHAQYGNFLIWIKGRSEDAEKVLRNAISLDPLNINIRQLWGLSLLRSNKLEQARKVMEDLVRDNPKYSEGYRVLGMVYSWGYYGEDLAISSYKEALSLDPSNPAPLVLIAESYLWLGDGDAAVFWYEQTFDKAPGKAKHYANLGLYELAKAEKKRAYDYLSLVDRSDWLAPLSIHFSATKDLQDGDMQRALKHYEAAFPELTLRETEITSRLFPAAVGYAQVLMECGFQDEANDILKRASGIASGAGSKFDFYNTYVIQYLLLSGQQEKAISTLEKFAGDGVMINFLEEHLALPSAQWIYQELKPNADFLKLVDKFEKIRKRQLQNLSSNLGEEN